MLVLDANILIRAVLGSRVLHLLRTYATQIDFVAPDTAYAEAREQLPLILKNRGIPIAPAMDTLDLVSRLVQSVDLSVYSCFENAARERIDRRDQDDWPVLALSLMLDCPIWTEDTDFFGCGVATWTTQTVELYLAKASDHPH